ncbi:hypothetical protein C8Q77DRAFT_892221 [Trametes polyzona]|nr:hypothetical protein C8Q77DRAFT_892221 [Trametes polyzona]
MIQRWNSEIDTYLVYAGLFSAILTAFNVQSYLLLQQAPPDPTLAVLQQISLQLSSFSTSIPPTFINSTYPALGPGSSPSDSPTTLSAVWLNTLWFSSLILSLSSASVGIMVKQWVNEYNSGIASGTSRAIAQLRQYRLNGLIGWHVRHIVMAIPILLQVSLGLFLAGLLVLLWTLNQTVATVVSVLVGILFAFVVLTTLLPLIKPGCAYLSPQTLALYAIGQQMVLMIRTLRYRFFWSIWRVSLWVRAESPQARRAFSGVAAKVSKAIDDILWTCAGRSYFQKRFMTWLGRERAAL